MFIVFLTLFLKTEIIGYNLEFFNFIIPNKTNKKEIIETLGQGLELNKIKNNYLLYLNINTKTKKETLIQIKFNNNKIVEEIKFIELKKTIKNENNNSITLEDEFEFFEEYKTLFNIE